jgi:hypothetical protein
MSRTLNELRRNSTSRVPGLRLNERRGYCVVDVTWYDPVTGRRRATSFLADKRPVDAVSRAMQRRVTETGADYGDLTAAKAWRRLKFGAECSDV